MPVTQLTVDKLKETKFRPLLLLVTHALTLINVNVTHNNYIKYKNKHRTQNVSVHFWGNQCFN